MLFVSLRFALFKVSNRLLVEIFVLEYISSCHGKTAGCTKRLFMCFLCSCCCSKFNGVVGSCGADVKSINNAQIISPPEHVFCRLSIILPSMNTRHSIGNIAHISTAADNRFLHLARIELDAFALHMALVGLGQHFIGKDIYKYTRLGVSKRWFAPFFFVVIYKYHQSVPKEPK